MVALAIVSVKNFGPKQEIPGHSASKEAATAAAAKRQKRQQLLPLAVLMATWYKFALHICFRWSWPIVEA